MSHLSHEGVHLCHTASTQGIHANAIRQCDSVTRADGLPSDRTEPTLALHLDSVEQVVYSSTSRLHLLLRTSGCKQKFH